MKNIRRTWQEPGQSSDGWCGSAAAWTWDDEADVKVSARLRPTRSGLLAGALPRCFRGSARIAMFQFGMLLQLVELVENLSTAISNPLLVRGFEDLSKPDAVVEGHVLP